MGSKPAKWDPQGISEHSLYAKTDDEQTQDVGCQPEGDSVAQPVRQPGNQNAGACTGQPCKDVSDQGIDQCPMPQLFPGTLGGVGGEKAQHGTGARPSEQDECRRCKNGE